jgi:hypothetical protein
MGGSLFSEKPTVWDKIPEVQGDGEINNTGRRRG